MLHKLRTTVAAVALAGAALVPVATATPAQACCGNGWAIGHASDDTGANFAIKVKVPPNGTVVNLSLGQWAMATQVYVEAGYKIQCQGTTYYAAGWNFIRSDVGLCYRRVA